MFVTTRDAGVRRRNRIYTNPRAARSSKISLLSAFTVTTTGSGGSNSTITQDSYNRSQRPRRKHRRRVSHEDKNKSVDVFDFLVEEKSRSKESLQPTDVKEEDHETGTESDGEEILHDDAKVDITVQLDEQEPEPEGFYRSLSDSGISMASSSTSSGPKHSRLPVLHEEAYDYASPQPRPGRELALIDPRWRWSSSSPQPYTESYVPSPCPAPPSAVMYEVPAYPPYPYPPYTPYGTPPPPMHQEAVNRPGITIREPAGQKIKPRCFRSFARLSSRLILQMQDDIAGLEAELKQLDKESDMSELGSDHSSSSSRSNRKERKIREEEIYRDLHPKLDNYCKKQCGWTSDLLTSR